MKIFRYADDIEWSLPLFLEDEIIYFEIIEALKYQQADITIKANLFGAPTTKWSSGRRCKDIENKPLNMLETRIQDIRKYMAYPTFTFSNSSITEDDLKDKYANDILDMALQYDCRFIVANDLLKDYIKSKDDKACVVLSVITPAMKFQGTENSKNYTVEAETEFYNSKLKDYDVVVVRPEYSKRILTQHPEYIDDLSRIEVLINQVCIENCPFMPEHYRFFERQNAKQIPYKDKFKCIKRTNPQYLRSYPIIHTPQEIETLVKSGIKRLKIQGRSVGHHPLTLLHMITEQMFEANEFGTVAKYTSANYLTKFINTYLNKK